MEITTRTLAPSILLVALLAFAACGGADDTEAACGATADHIGACFGSSAAAAFSAGSCDAVMAGRLSAMSCTALRGSIFDSKADSDLGEQIRDAVRRSLRDAVRQALQTAVDQVLQALGARALSSRVYIVLAQTSWKSTAQAKVKSLGRVVRDQGWQPAVVKLSRGYAVVHDRCPIRVDRALADALTEVVLDNPSLIEKLGGAVKRTSRRTGSTTMNVHLPLSVLPASDALAKALGCQQ